MEYKERLNEYEKLYETLHNKLVEASKNEDIAWGKLWLHQLYTAGLEKRHKEWNSAFIWFKNAQYRGIFKEIINDVHKLSGLLYLKAQKLEETKSK